jgi:eukaryotic-like serine/threonine-protein kinase
VATSDTEGSGSPVFVDPMIGRVLLGGYEVLRRIGSGGMGAVYAAKQKTIGREVAVKVLRGDLMSNELVRERFRREAEIIGKLRHPNTIQLIDYGETEDGLALMVMELLVGTPLNEQLKGSGPMTLSEAIQIGIDVASSLAEAHEAGLVHRDLKPGNIFLVEVGGQTHAKVLDFGIARILDEEATRITSTGQVFGTPRYMSPEQGMATGEVDARSDLYSLGLIIYECMVGQPPFVAQTSIQYLSAHATTPPPKLSQNIKKQIPLELEQLVDACLVKHPTHRIQTARDVVEALKRIAMGVDQKERIDSGKQPTIGESAIADLLPQTQAPGTVPAGIPQFAAAQPLPITEAPSTVVEEPKKSSPVFFVVGFASLILAALIFGAMALKGDQKVRSITLGDAGLVEAVAAIQIDAGVITKPALDAGTTYPDAASSPERKKSTKTGKTRVKRDRTSKRSTKKTDRKTSSDHALPGVGGISGPRGLTIDVGDENPDVEAAKACRKSQLSAGTATLKLVGCAPSCAVLLDGTCAGRTPLQQTGFKKGNKALSVVCKGKVVVDEIARLRNGKSLEFRCK